VNDAQAITTACSPGLSRCLHSCFSRARRVGGLLSAGALPVPAGSVVGAADRSATACPFR